jgi:branched-chain amino acid transport system substrate-binding protein
VDALAPDCALVTGPLGEEGVITLGSILPTEGDAATIGRPLEQAARLALLEINDAGGLGGGRRLAMVHCDSRGNRAQGVEVARHLVERLGVPLIIGPAFSSVFIDVTTQVSAPGGTMTLSPSATSPLIAGIDDRGLGWRTAASDAFQAVAIADLVRTRGFRRVVALGKDDAYGRGLLDRVGSELVTDLGEDAFFGALYPDPGAVANPDFATVVARALEAQPDAEVALLLGTNEAAAILQLFERALGERAAPATLRYVLTDGGKVDETLSLVAASPALLPRVEGTEPDHRNGAVHTAFGLRFQQRFGASPGIFAANAYDAVYLAALALAAEPGTPPTGASIAASFARLVKGRPIEAGPSAFGEARAALGAGGAVDFIGASGPLDFDLEVGEAPANVARWVVERRMNGTHRFVASGRYPVDASGRGTWELGE